MKQAVLVLAAFAVFCASVAAQSIVVRPVMDLPKDFIVGADVSMLDALERAGATFSDENGRKGDCLAILKAGGANWVRLRLWNDPVNAADVVEGGKILSKAGEPVGGGNDDLAAYVRIAKRAKKLGLKVMVDFHYSDFWADPGKQFTPRAWAGLGLDELEKALYKFTDASLRAMRSAGAMPDTVQIGNEVDNGFLWPVGKLYPSGDEKVDGMDAFVALLKEAPRAVWTNDPAAGAKHGSAADARRIKIMIHLSSGADRALYGKTFDPIIAAGVDFDVIGLSFYPYWHGRMTALVGRNESSPRGDDGSDDPGRPWAPWRPWTPWRKCALLGAHFCRSGGSVGAPTRMRANAQEGTQDRRDRRVHGAVRAPCRGDAAHQRRGRADH